MLNQNHRIIEAFTQSLPEYLRDVETTSGKLFYSIAWKQMECIIKDKQDALDMGCGFGLTSIWLSEQGYHVTGIDITPDMIKAAKQKAKEKKQEITFIQGELESVQKILKGKTFDFIICHNVLGYLDQPVEALEKLKGLLNPKGYLSIIVHNPTAKVLMKAIGDKDVKMAKELVNQEKEFNPLIKAYVNQYSHPTYLKWFNQLELDLIRHYGIRCVFDYMQQNGIKGEGLMNFEDLLELELHLGSLTPYRDIAFFYHFILQKH